MRQKLLFSAFGIITIILLIVAGNQVIIRLFSNSSNKLILEYHELHSLQELKVSLSKTSTLLSMIEGMPAVEDEEFRHSILESTENLKQCQDIISEVHQGQSWQNINETFGHIISSGNQFLSADHIARRQMTTKLNAEIDQVIVWIDEIVSETLLEIEIFERLNKTVVKHGSLTILIVGILLIVFLAAGSWRFIQNITRPVDQLVSSMKKIEAGNTGLTVVVDSEDEFNFLANSINSMLDALNSSTVSKIFLSKVLDNLFGALIVTDSMGRISFINQTVSLTLNYSIEELNGTDCMLLFNLPARDMEIDKHQEPLQYYTARLPKATEMKSKSGQLIPAYVTCTVLKDEEGLSTGMVVVGHDLTEEKKYEEKIEKFRKARLMAINEAQENERIRFAKDLHDGLGQILTGISYQVQSLNPTNEEEVQTLEQISIQIQSAILEAKNIAHNLTPVILRDFGLIPALENLVSKTNLLNKTKVIFNNYDFDQRIDAHIEKALFRICQECINNIIKHAEARNASIELFRKTNYIVLVIEDDGRGFDPNSLNSDKPSGIGLLSIKQRTYVFDGLFTLNTNPGEGTEILIEIPCPTFTENHG